MAVNDRKGLSFGRGLVFDATNNLCLGEFATNWEAEPETTIERLKFAHVKGSLPVEIDENWKFRAKFRELTPALFAMMTGNSVATGALYYNIANFTASTLAITLTPIGTGVDEVLYMKLISADTYRTIAGSAVQDVSATRSGATITLAASDAGTNGVFQIAYLYADTAATDGKIVISPTTFPSRIRLVAPFAWRNPVSGAVTYGVLDSAKAVCTKKPKLGGNVQEFAEHDVEFDLINSAANDLIFYTNGYNPTY